jgi:hypothetical protein
VQFKVNPTGTFAMSADDWKLFNQQVPGVLQQFFNDGYKIVVFRYT